MTADDSGSPERPTASAGAEPPAMSLRGLTRTFGEKRAVDDLSLEIPAGTFYGICGPNGAGKTTTLKMATGLLRPSGGSVAVDGIDVWADPVAAKAHFGFVPDNPKLFDRLNGPELLEFVGALRSMDPAVVRERSEEILTAPTCRGRVCLPLIRWWLRRRCRPPCPCGCQSCLRHGLLCG